MLVIKTISGKKLECECAAKSGDSKWCVFYTSHLSTEQANAFFSNSEDIARLEVTAEDQGLRETRVLKGFTNIVTIRPSTIPNKESLIMIILKR